MSHIKTQQELEITTKTLLAYIEFFFRQHIYQLETKEGNSSIHTYYIAYKEKIILVTKNTTPINR